MVWIRLFLPLLGFYISLLYLECVWLTCTEILSGDNFFKTASYTIEALCAKTYEDTTEKLKEIEAQILRKRTELRQFETEYRKVILSGMVIP